MTPKRAKEVLTEMNVSAGFYQLLSDESDNLIHAHGTSTGKSVALSGDFTADQLEAIACWMRDPKEVTEA